MVTVDQVLNVLPVAALSISLIYYGMNLRKTNKTQQILVKTRQVQLYMQVMGNIGTREFLRHYFEIMYDHEYNSYEEWMEKYGPRTNREAYISYYYVTRIFQNLAYLVRDGVLTVETLAEQGRPQGMVSLWEKISPIVRYHRENINEEAYSSLEYLCKEMKKVLERRK